MKGIAIIKPVKDINDKEEVLCELRFIDKSNRHTNIIAPVKTSIFKYYFYGVTIEVVELDDSGNVIDIHDLDKESLLEYNLRMNYALSFSFVGNSMVSLATNGLVYYLEQSTFFRNYSFVADNMYKGMLGASNFVFRYYTIDDEIVYIQLETNKGVDAIDFKYALHNGFVISDRTLLKSLLPKTQADFVDSNEKLSQGKIAALIDKLNKEV